MIEPVGGFDGKHDSLNGSRRYESLLGPDKVISDRQMREQTRAYVRAVMEAYPELTPDEEFVPDPYPALPVKPLLPLSGIRAVAYAVGRAAGLSLAELRGDSRSKHVVRARHECFARCRAQGYSLPVIARFFNRDHTTVYYGLQRMGCIPGSNTR